MELTKYIALKFTLNKGIKLYGVSEDRFYYSLALLTVLFVLNTILATVVYIFIKDTVTGSRAMNHFIYPQASMQVIY